MKIVSVASHVPVQPYYLYHQFLSSVRKYGHEPLMLGQDWSGIYGGLGTKLKLLKTALEQNRVEDDDMVFCDSYDVVFQQDPILALERAIPDALTFNCEKNLFPHTDAPYPDSPTLWRYLNSGFIVGKTQLFKDIVNGISEHDMRPDSGGDNPNDQATWAKMYCSGQYPIKLDHETKVCLCMHGVTEQELDFSGPLIKNAVTGEEPVCCHLNGSHEIWKDRVLHKLGL